MHAQQPIDLKGAKILIVDDVPANLKVLRGVLEPEGFRILFAPCGEVALKIARSETPDLILLDVMMPEMDGYEVCRQLKANPVTAEIPVIFITAKDEAEDIVKGLRLGGVDYISKPFQSEVVVARAETHLKNSRFARELRQKNQELEIARDAAEQAKRTQSAFLAAMSHEIRTPMNGVMGMTALLLETQLAAEQRDCVETIRTGSRSLLAIINQILDFSKIESGKMELENHPFDLNAVLEGTVELLGPRAAEKNLCLGYLPELGLPETLIGDETRLRQILLNLAGNAVKFTAGGEVVISITKVPPENAPASDSEIILLFSVRDTGMGIPEERMNRLFHAFSQMDSSTTRQFGGTGLGLAISKRLAELMDGTLWVQSKVNEGSTFHCSVPFRIQKEEHGGDVSRALKLSGERILVIESHPTTREILGRLLTNLELQPHCVSATEEALACLAAAPANVVILDRELPERDLLSLSEAIARLPSEDSPELILVTARPLGTETRRLGGIEARAVVSKPIRRSQLARALRRAANPDEPEFEAAGVSPDFDPLLAERHPLRILLADDYDVNQMVGARILQGFGYRCELAANGIEVIQALERQSFDVVFLDVQMPEMDGYEAARQIRKRWSDTERPRLVAMTANALCGDREKCLEAGMDDYVSKPVEISEVRRALEQSGKQLIPGTASSGAPRKEPPAVAEQGLVPSEKPSENPIDWERLKRMLGEDGNTVREFVELYLRKTSAQIEELRAAVESANAAEATLLAHRCKGASATCGILALVQPMTQLERAAKSEDWPACSTYFAEAQTAFHLVQKLLVERFGSSKSAGEPD